MKIAVGTNIFGDCERQSLRIKSLLKIGEGEEKGIGILFV